MSTEIKIVETDVLVILDELKSSIHSMEKGFSTNIAPNGNMTMIQRLNEVNQSLTLLIDTYQNFLTLSEKQTRTSVKVLKETDEIIASNMQK